MLQGPVNSASKAADAQFERYGDEFVAVKEKTSKSLIFSWIIMSSNNLAKRHLSIPVI
jgi:hypothetical protein